ncbi:alpha/beta fold hydrolase [Caenimonas sp. DR4.4]|uniref:Alpha/beta fold hydrolase n=1 Tax=Caenimonas aquaedulcis TaxID=2793270 RepID=A0A931MGV8_9BURK|nr:alpha/beta fold hydrolase [Caenimonas aquaedulcis]
MLARLQQAITLSLLACAAAWLDWFWATSPLLAVCGFVLIGMGYSLFLAAEFIALRLAGRAPAALRPGWKELLRAWLAETATAPRVFCWRQPFRWKAVPDELGASRDAGRKRGVVFIHGFFCNRGFWAPWLTRARAEGRCYAAVNLEPVFGSIDEYAPLIGRAVRAVTQATGLAPVVVCHSMGGLAARAWLRAQGGAAVHHVVTIGSPHRGTWLARFSRGGNGRQMQEGGMWLAELERVESARQAPEFTCWYSNCDNIVFPVLTATLPGADNRLVRGAAHVDLAFRPEVMDATFLLFERSDPR